MGTDAAEVEEVAEMSEVGVEVGGATGQVDDEEEDDADAVDDDGVDEVGAVIMDVEAEADGMPNPRIGLAGGAVASRVGWRCTCLDAPRNAGSVERARRPSNPMTVETAVVRKKSQAPASTWIDSRGDLIIQVPAW